MPKVKRFLNPLKSARESHDAHGRFFSLTIPAHSHAIEPSTFLQAPPHAPRSSSLVDEVPQQEQAPTQPSNPRATFARAVGRVSTQYWRVEPIDSNNATKHINVKVNEVNNLLIDERIIVNLDKYGAPYGEAQGLLAGYCGSLSIDGNLFPINFDRWSGPSDLPKKYMEDCFETLLKTRFLFRTTDAISYIYCNSSLNKKWATHRQRPWDEFYDPAKCRNEILRNMPVGIYRDQWAGFVAYRLKEETIELCKRNKEIQCKQKIPHTSGSKANLRRRHELEQIQLSQDSEFEISADDIIGKVLGAEHSGGYDVWVACLESQLEGTLTALKDYMISKKGGVPEEFVNMFAPQPKPSDDVGSKSTSPVNIRESLGDINGNDQANT